MRILLLSILSLIASLNVRAVDLPIFWGVGQSVNKVADLPKTDEYADKDGNHYDLATLHTEFTLFFLSVYIIDEPKLVLCDESEEHYIDLTDEEMDAVLEANNLDHDEMCQIGLFTRYGGKVIFGIIILCFLYACIKATGENKKERSDI